MHVFEIQENVYIEERKMEINSIMYILRTKETGCSSLISRLTYTLIIVIGHGYEAEREPVDM